MTTMKEHLINDFYQWTDNLQRDIMTPEEVMQSMLVRLTHGGILKLKERHYIVEEHDK